MNRGKNAENQVELSPRQIKTEIGAYNGVEEALRETFRRLEIAYDQSIIYAQHLNEEIRKRKRAEAALGKSEENYSRFVQNALSGIYIVQHGKIVHANDRFAEIFGYAKDELIGMLSLKLVHPKDKSLVKKMRTKRLKGEQVPSQYETRGFTKDGKTIWVARTNTRTEYQGKRAILGRVLDITEQKRAADALREKGEALKAHARKLEELTTALRIVLEQREEDRTRLEEIVVSKVKKRIFPYIEALKNTGLGFRQKAYASIIESNLKDIASPFSRNLTSKCPGLTTKEIQVANLIKEGKTTKEIAELLNVSTAGVDFHRKNLRKKLDLRKKSESLKGYMLSLT
ncbi:MAG: PAS domain S-box protein [Desulfobacterales bacterium]|nr:MAG: PAS domain S-box protein [Desulfobacterales bacterium]